MTLLLILVAVVLAGLIFYYRRMRATTPSVTDIQSIVLAQAILAELIENKNKCVAFMAIYTDLLQQLLNADNPASETGDFIHRYVPLQRQAYDTHWEALSAALTPSLQQRLQALYATISSETVYDEVQSSLDRRAALQRIEQVITATQTTMTACDDLIQALGIFIRDHERL